eukprot:11374793-Ditylum_brightwellii.AAC.1
MAGTTLPNWYTRLVHHQVKAPSQSPVNCSSRPFPVPFPHAVTCGHPPSTRLRGITVTTGFEMQGDTKSLALLAGYWFTIWDALHSWFSMGSIKDNGVMSDNGVMICLRRFCFHQHTEHLCATELFKYG